jgi:hypothetical protein
MAAYLTSGEDFVSSEWISSTEQDCLRYLLSVPQPQITLVIVQSKAVMFFHSPSDGNTKSVKKLVTLLDF